MSHAVIAFLPDGNARKRVPASSAARQPVTYGTRRAGGKSMVGSVKVDMTGKGSCASVRWQNAQFVRGADCIPAARERQFRWESVAPDCGSVVAIRQA
ncbi:MAG: hypothetical protein AMJ66_04780 [Betaproteobacteria bacterium SG8_40]|nr:MAG: hypothetical protein AMJ66_04780 [Betaproteobacteria bacterium SG8_40]